MQSRVNYENFGEQLYERREFTLMYLKISSRIFNYWKKNEILPGFSSQNKAKFNFVEASWLLVLDKLRKVGFPVELLKKLTKEFLIDSVKNKVADQIIKDNIAEFKLNPARQHEVDSLEHILSNQRQMKQLRHELNYFSQLIKDVLITKEDAGILINESNDCSIYYQDQFNSQENLNRLLRHFHIVIPIKPIIHSLIMKEIDNGSYNIPFLKNEEAFIVRELRNKDVSAIIVTNGNDTFIVKSAKKTPSDKELCDYFMNGTFQKYDSAELTLNNGQKAFFSLRSQSLQL